MRIIGSLIFLFLLLSVPVLSDVPSTFDAPDSGLATNTVIDIVQHGGGVWLASGRGLNFTLDLGQQWLLYDVTNGLVSDNVSAIASVGNRLWIGTSHSQIIDQENVAISDGLSYTDDNGQTWDQIDFGSTGLNIVPPVIGGNRVIYDITGYNNGLLGRDWLFFAAFAGGLLASQDGGTNWRRIFPSPSDSTQFVDNNVPSYRNRYFSSVIDTSHTDSLFLWVGTAGGLFQFIYTTPPNKLFTKDVFDIGVCEECSDSASQYAFLGGDDGAIRGRKTGRPFITRFESDGLPGPEVSAIFGFANRIFAGTVDTTTGYSAGLAVSDDLGQSYSPVILPEVIGEGRNIVAFALMNDRIYLAAQQAGLFVSADTGQTWDAILVDSANTDLAYNVVNSLYAYKDSLLLGTDSGLVIFEMDSVGDIQQMTHKVFVENPFTSAKIIKVKLQPFESDSTAGVIDSTVIWTVNRPVSLAGTPMVGRSVIDNDTLAFESFKVDTFSYDIGFVGDTAYVVWERGIKYTVNGTNPSIDVAVYDSLYSSLNFTNDTLLVLKTLADTLLLGTTDGWAVSPNAGDSWAVFRGNRDTLAADLVVNYTYSNTVNIDTSYVTLGLTGDFIPAIGVQYRDDGPARVWVSGRPVSVGINGMTVGLWVPVRDTLGDSIGVRIKFRALYGGDFAWNYAFYGDSVFAATNAGVLMNYGDTSEVWDTVAFVDPVKGYDLLAPGTAAFAVRVIGDDLWVGTSDGTLRKSLVTPSDVELFVRVDSTSPEDEVYAFPVPFSAVRGESCQFHFNVKQAAYVTLEIYDFAMNLVARPIDNVYFEPGSYPNGSSERYRWDGYNGKGDAAAVGVYYFKVEYSTGEVRWGKLAVIP